MREQYYNRENAIICIQNLLLQRLILNFFDKTIVDNECNFSRFKCTFEISDDVVIYDFSCLSSEGYAIAESTVILYIEEGRSSFFVNEDGQHSMLKYPRITVEDAWAIYTRLFSENFYSNPCTWVFQDEFCVSKPSTQPRKCGGSDDGWCQECGPYDNVVPRKCRHEAEREELLKKAAIIEESKGVALYFFKDNRLNRVKIGRSIQPLSRLATKENEIGFSLEVLAIWEGAGYMEKGVHARFNKYRDKKGEWFNFTDEIDAFIKAGPAH